MCMFSFMLTIFKKYTMTIGVTYIINTSDFFNIYVNFLMKSGLRSLLALLFTIKDCFWIQF